MGSSVVSRIAEAYAAIVWGLFEARTAITLARDLLEEGLTLPSVVRLAALEDADGPEALRACLDDVVRELDIATDQLSRCRALVRAAAGAVERNDLTIEAAVECLARAYDENTEDHALAHLYGLREDHSLIVARMLAGDPATALARYRDALLEHAAAREL